MENRKKLTEKVANARNCAIEAAISLYEIRLTYDLKSECFDNVTCELETVIDDMSTIIRKLKRLGLYED